MLRKIQNLDADAYIIDLEDSISEKEKEQALEETENFLHTMNIARDLFVRVNLSSMDKEMKRLNQFADIGYMIPKFEVKNEIIDLVCNLGNRKIIALVETPKGLADINQIASYEWVNAIALGGEDYTAAMNMENSMQMLYYAKSRIVMYSKAHKKQVFDTPSFVLDNDDLLVEEITNAERMGFDGKLAISPRHIEKINKIFGKHDIEEMKKIVFLYEKSGEAVFKFEGKIYEKMHIARMKKIIQENGE